MVLLRIAIGTAVFIQHYSEQGIARQRNKPYYVEIDTPMHGLAVFGFDTRKDAVIKAKEWTAGMYHLTGRLNDRYAEVYERGGKLIGTVRSGLTGPEYIRVKAENERKAKEEEKRKEEERKRKEEERKKEGYLMAFRWDPSKVR